MGHLSATAAAPPVSTYCQIFDTGSGGRIASTVSATATPATSGSSRGGSRTTTEHSSARPAGATQARPCRPRPLS